MNFSIRPIASVPQERLGAAVEDNLRHLGVQLLQLPPVVRTFADASSAALTYNLPDGNKQLDKDYYYEKIDSSVNGVTITPFGTQTIQGAASYTLAAQYDRVLLMWYHGDQQWHIL